MDRPTATVLAGATRSITVLINGGQIAFADVERSVEAGRWVLVISGSGRTADVFAAALARVAGDTRSEALVDSGLLSSVRAGDAADLAALLGAVLTESGAPT